MNPVNPALPASCENFPESQLAEAGRRGPAHARSSLVFVAAVLLGSFLYAYWSVVVALVGTWWNVMAYHHGFLIPAFALYLVWSHRIQILEAAAAPQYLTGSSVCLLSFLLLFVGHAAAFLTLQYIALPLTLAGAAILLFGKHVFRIVGPPIGYLTLMLPAWDILLDRIQYPSQLLSAELATHILRALGTPAVREGIQIALPGLVVEVAPDCSGLNYMLAFVAVGIPLGILLLDRWTTRLLLISSTLGIAFLGNSLRIALVGWLAGDSGDAPYHDISGLFVAGLGFVVLFAGVLVASRGRRASSRPATGTRGADAEARTADATAENRPLSAFVRTGTFRRLGLLLSAGLVLEGVLLDLHREKPVPLQQDIARFPLELGAWTARPDGSGVASDLELSPDGSLDRVYERASGPKIGLYLAYFTKQEQGKELVDYRTDEQYRAASPATLDLGARGALQANSVILEDQGVQKLRLFWWELDGRSVKSPYTVKFLTVYDSVIRGRSNGALVVLEIEVGSEEGASARALTVLAEFVQELLAAIKIFLRPGSPPTL